MLFRQERADDTAPEPIPEAATECVDRHGEGAVNVMHGKAGDAAHTRGETCLENKKAQFCASRLGFFGISWLRG